MSLTVEHAFDDLMGAVAESLAEIGMELGLRMADGTEEEANGIYARMLRVSAIRQDIRELKSRCLTLIGGSNFELLSTRKDLVKQTEQPIFEPSVSEEPVSKEPISEESASEEPIFESPVFEEPLAAASSSNGASREPAVDPVLPEPFEVKVFEPEAAPQKAVLVFAKEDFLAPKSARQQPKAGKHTKKLSARRTLPQGTYTETHTYVPYLLRAMLYCSKDDAFSHITRETIELMKEERVAKPADLEKTGSGCYRYQAQLGTVRKGLINRGLLVSLGGGKYMLTDIGRAEANQLDGQARDTHASAAM